MDVAPRARTGGVGCGVRLLLLFLAACGGFEFRADVTVDPAIGTVMVDGKAKSSILVEESFESLEAANDEPIDLEVEDAMGVHSFDLRVYLANCRGRAIGEVEREDVALFLASGADGLSLVFQGATCSGTEGSYSAQARR
jgi:hypothetical protein